MSLWQTQGVAIDYCLQLITVYSMKKARGSGRRQLPSEQCWEGYF